LPDRIGNLQSEICNLQFENVYPTTMKHFRYLLVLAGLAFAGCQGSSEPPPIYLGHVANLSGADHAGKHAEQGIRLALQQLTDHDLAEALGGRPLHVRHADTKGQLEGYESVAARLTQVNRVVGLLGGFTPDEVARLDHAKIPVLTLAGVRPAGASEMVFAVGMRPSQQAFALARCAALELRTRDVVVLADQRREEFLALADAFGRYYNDASRNQPVPVVTNVTMTRFGSDAKWEELAKQIVERKSLGAVLFAGSARDWLEIRRKQKMALPLLFAGSDGDVANLEGADAPETIYHATAFAPDKDAPESQVFIQKYRDAFKEEPDVAAALAFESLGLFAEALKPAGPTFAADKLLSALREIKDFPGLCGKLTVTKEQYVRRPLYVVRLHGAAQTVLKRYEPDTLP
jgi:branched-chain amino acid transport system substrate-binding protein